MDFPKDRLYSEDHMWVKKDRDYYTIGLTDYAKEELGEVDYVELPQPEDVLTKDKAFGIVETSKAVTDLIAPISGMIVESNVLLTESPETLSDDPYGDGWLAVLDPSDPDELSELLRYDQYERLVKGDE